MAYTQQQIEDTVAGWLAGEVPFDDAVEKLEELQNSRFPKLATLAQEKIAFITLEENYNSLKKEAEDHILSGEFPEAFVSLNNIDLAYSNYGAIVALYSLCQDRVLETVADPKSIEDFETFMILLSDCLEVYDSKEISTRQKQLSNELVIFMEVTEIVQTATELYDFGQYAESFVTLAIGIEKYPDNEHLATTLVDYHDHYIISVTREAVAFCEEENYKEALKTVEAAIEEYDCEEFRLLQESIREQKSFLYRFKNDLVAKFMGLAQGWESEEFDVNQAASSAGAYVVKSGEKLFLGDYSEESVTILSFSGNVIASLANVDFLFDLRDLTYDIVHFGEEDCFAVYLAADVIALLPVIGVVKYFDHFKTVADGVRHADLVDSVADIAKGSAKASKAADAVKGTSKTGKSIIESIGAAKNAARVGEAAKDVVTDISKEYQLVQTINCKLLGSKHPETGGRVCPKETQILWWRDDPRGIP